MSAMVKGSTWGVVFVALAFVCGSGCGDDEKGGGGGGNGTPTRYSVGGNVSGLAGTGLVLQNNGAGDLPISADGTFVFTDRWVAGTAYDVTVLTQPTAPGQSCTVSAGAGTVGTADVTDVAVTCVTDTYAVGGTATGIAGSVTLQNDGGDDLVLDTDGAFTFPTQVAEGDTYSVTVASSTGNICTLSGATGTVGPAVVTTISLSCEAVTVLARYPSGSQWTAHVLDDDSGTACTGAELGGCVHAGELLAVPVPGAADCTGLTAVDTLGAFDWECEVTTSPAGARMVSTGLSAGVNLSDLIDFTTPDWKDNQVIISDGSGELARTVPGAWWPNAVTLANTGLTAGTTSEWSIYVVDQDVTAAYELGTSHTALVVAPGAAVTGPGTGAAVVAADGLNFVWLEGELIGGGEDEVVRVSGGSFALLRNVTASAGANWEGSISLVGTGYARLVGVLAFDGLKNGIYLTGTTATVLEDVTCRDNGNTGLTIDGGSGDTILGLITRRNGSNGLRLSSATDTIVRNVRSDSNSSAGVTVTASTGVRLSDIVVGNNGASGIDFTNGSTDSAISTVVAFDNGSSGLGISDSSSIYASQVLSMANDGYGIEVLGSTNCAVTHAASLLSYGTGIYAGDGTTALLMVNVAAIGNGDVGFAFEGGLDASTLIDLTATGNGSNGITLIGATNNLFAGELLVGNNDATGSDEDCYVSGGTNPGMTATAGSCEPAGRSTFTAATTGVDALADLVGAVTSDDSVNTSDSSGTSVWDDIGDWLGFEHIWRGWTLDGNAGSCGLSSTCRIWDASVKSSATTLRAARALPASGEAQYTTEHSWVFVSQGECTAKGGLVGGECAGAVATNPVACSFGGGTWTWTTCIARFFATTFEVVGDGQGNDNGLCESQETCVHGPNYGVYQGHGALSAAQSISTGGVIYNVEILAYDTNGR